jgi:hypothetical protein
VIGWLIIAGIMAFIGLTIWLGSRCSENDSNSTNGTNGQGQVL